ncbi:hypothetical protein OESDEN_23383 [Oesophagostomum dentatum]|uniref:G-protein coupled receptors family 1 profile domain-containing protein n=1 Tax=Oesophagostomum dentatum TaxID=61180 RepID=A0A0B1S0J0_OESDE|nr:hypothetical protein OESDEN_23383 [Oesophagostomum dentatum]
MVHIRAMNRLGMNMATFAIGSIPILVVCIVALANLRSLASLGEGEKSPCKTYLSSHLFVQVEILAATAAIVWLIAMILDPIINTAADRKIMSMLRNWLHCFRKTVKSVHRQMTLTTQVTKDTDGEDRTDTATGYPQRF